MYRLFIDLDGVLADFDSGVRTVTGKYPNEMAVGHMWAVLARTHGFYAHLDWMPDGKDLWTRISGHFPVILTGLPRGSWAEPQKREWCRRELGPDVPVICCMTREKAVKASGIPGPGEIPVLVDDREKTRDSWIEMGGVFVHHVSAESSLAALEGLGLCFHGSEHGLMEGRE